MARLCDDAERVVIVPNHIQGAKLYTWHRNEPGDELFENAAPIIAWRIPAAYPDEPAVPIAVGFPLLDVWPPGRSRSPANSSSPKPR